MRESGRFFWPPIKKQRLAVHHSLLSDRIRSRQFFSFQNKCYEQRKTLEEVLYVLKKLGMNGRKLKLKPHVTVLNRVLFYISRYYKKWSRWKYPVVFIYAYARRCLRMNERSWNYLVWNGFGLCQEFLQCFYLFAFQLLESSVQLRLYAHERLNHYLEN